MLAEFYALKLYEARRLKKNHLGGNILYRRGQAFCTKFDPLNISNNELHTILKHWNLEICNHSRFFPKFKIFKNLYLICLLVQTPMRFLITSALCFPFHLSHHLVTNSFLSVNIWALASEFVWGVHVDNFIPVDLHPDFDAKDILWKFRKKLTKNFNILPKIRKFSIFFLGFL